MRFSHDESVEAVRRYFDELGETEWERLDTDIPGKVSYQIHLHFMRRFIEDGMRVLEIGAGPGRFTAPLVELGAKVLVSDVSPVQLELNKKHMAEAGVEGGIEGWEIIDLSDTSRFDSSSFDAILAYGGPLSYVFDRAQDALDGLFRIAVPGGPVVASVMSTLGSYRYLLDAVVEIGGEFGEEANDRILETGDLREIQPPGTGLHTCRMFRSEEINAMVRAVGGRVEAMSASNWASLGPTDVLETLMADPDRWHKYLEREIFFASQSGAVDGGTHLLFAATRD